MKLSKLVVLLIIIYLVSCKEEVILSDTYIGTYRIYDQEIPYPYFLYPENDKWTISDNLGNTTSTIQAHRILQAYDTLKFPNHDWYLSLVKDDKIAVYDLMDTIRFSKTRSGQINTTKSAVYKRLHRSQAFDLPTVQEILVSHVWNYTTLHRSHNIDLDIENQLSFNENSYTHRMIYRYHDVELYTEYLTESYHLLELDNMLFFVIEGTDKDQKPIFQITTADNNKIVWNNFSKRLIAEETLSAIDISKEKFADEIQNATHFELCYSGYQGEYYFGEDVTYLHGNDYLVQKIAKHAPLASQDGYITVQFFINCDGYVGYLGLEQMDRSFKPIQYNTKLISHIIKEVRALKEWPFIISDYEHLFRYEDVGAFLMFKIRNGKIVDVCP